MAFKREDIESGVAGVASKVFKMDTDSVNMETRWREDLNVKSVHGMKICALLNMQFKIKVPMKRLLKSATLGETVTLVEDLVQAQ